MFVVLIRCIPYVLADGPRRFASEWCGHALPWMRRTGAEPGAAESVIADLAGCQGMNAVSVDTLRLYRNVAAPVWVGGPILLAALVPARGAAGTAVPRAAANAFDRIAGQAFGVLVVPRTKRAQGDHIS